MKRMKIWSILMLVAMALLTAVACGGDDDDEEGNGEDTPAISNIVGTWRYYFQSNDPNRGQVYNLVTFKSDNTGMLIEEVGYGSDNPNYFVWTQTSSTIRISFIDSGYSETWQIMQVIDGNTVVVSDGKHQFTFYRDGTQGGNPNSGNYSPDDGNTSNNDTINNPITVAEIYDIVVAMPKDEVSAYAYCAKGKVCSIKYPFSAEYGTSVFNISDTGYTGSREFTVYATYYKALGQKWIEGNPQIAVGDEVVVYGQVVNYRGTTPEFADKLSYIVTINGK